MLTLNSIAHGLVANSFCDTQNSNACLPFSLAKAITTTSLWKIQNLVMMGYLKKKKFCFLERLFLYVQGASPTLLVSLTGYTYCSPRHPRAARLHSQNRWHSNGALGSWCHTWWWCILESTDQSVTMEGLENLLKCYIVTTRKFSLNCTKTIHVERESPCGGLRFWTRE